MAESKRGKLSKLLPRHSNSSVTLFFGALAFGTLQIIWNVISLAISSNHLKFYQKLQELFPREDHVREMLLHIHMLYFFLMINLIIVVLDTGVWVLFRQPYVIALFCFAGFICSTTILLELATGPTMVPSIISETLVDNLLQKLKNDSASISAIHEFFDCCHISKEYQLEVETVWNLMGNGNPSSCCNQQNQRHSTGARGNGREKHMHDRHTTARTGHTFHLLACNMRPRFCLEAVTQDVYLDGTSFLPFHPGVPILSFGSIVCKQLLYS